MKILNVEGNVVENPDLELGHLVISKQPIKHHYIVTQEEAGYYEIIAEYPNGGKDVEWKIDTPEEGHWVTYDEKGNEIKTDIIIPDDAPHEIDIDDFEEVYTYIPYTEEELKEKEMAELRGKEARTLEERVTQTEADISFIAMMSDIDLGV